MSAKGQTLLTVACLVGILIAAVLIRLPLLSIPLERDEGMYAYVAWRMSDGEVPYRDVFDHKPPGIYGLYWLSLALFGHSGVGIHLFGAIYNALIAGLVFVLGAMLYDRWMGLVAAAAFGVMSVTPAYNGQAFNTETAVLLPMVASLVLLWTALKRRRAAAWTFASGAASGVAVLFKHSALPVVVLLLVVLVVQRLRQGARRTGVLAEAVALGAGFAAPVAATVVLFWALGALGPLYEAVVRENLAYGATGLEFNWGLFIWQLLEQGWRPELAFWLFGALGLIVLAARRAGEDLFILGTFVACAVGVCMGMRFFPHYFIQLLPATAVAFAVGVRFVWERLRAINATVRWLLRAAIVLLCALAPFLGDASYFFVYSPEQSARAIYGSWQPFDQSALLAEHIQSHTRPDEKVFILGSEPQVYFLARRACCSRYAYVFPLIVRTEQAVRGQQEALAEIKNAPPSYLLIVTYHNSIGVTKQTPDVLFAGLTQLVRESYFLDGYTDRTAEGFVFVTRQGTGELFSFRDEKGSLQRLRSGKALVQEGAIPGPDQIQLFRRRAPGQTFPDIRDDWEFAVNQ